MQFEDVTTRLLGTYIALNHSRVDTNMRLLALYGHIHENAVLPAERLYLVSLSKRLF